MSITELHPGSRSRHQSTVDVEIVIPVYNEAKQLAGSITALWAYLESTFPFVASITIADNASTVDTWRVANELAATLPWVSAVHLDEKGRGRALRATWSQSTASVVAYMDVDLATDLDALLPLVAPLLSGHSDLAIGTRLAPGAHVVRGTRREFISRGYNLVLRSALRSACSDAQCGFKAMRREAAVELLPLVDDDGWFFDTEILIAAQRRGLRIHEVPVDWVDDTDSRVEVVHTALQDLRGVWRLLGPAARTRVATRSISDQPVEEAQAVPGRPPVTPLPDSRPRLVSERRGPASTRPGTEVFAEDLIRFAGVGAVSTIGYVALFAALEPSLGPYLANAVAIALSSLGNTAAHRGMAGAARHGLDCRQRVATATALLGISLGFTTAALVCTRAVGLASMAPQLCAVSAANVCAAVIRFGVLRTWVFRPDFGAHLPAAPVSEDAGDPIHQPDEQTRTPS